MKDTNDVALISLQTTRQVKLQILIIKAFLGKIGQGIQEVGVRRFLARGPFYLPPLIN